MFLHIKQESVENVLKDRAIMDKTMIRKSSWINIYNTFKHIIKKNQKFYLIYINFLIIIISCFFTFVPGFFLSLPINTGNTIPILAGITVTFAFLGLIYPFFGNIPGSLKKPKSFILWAFLAKIILTVIMQLLGFFPGEKNFIVDYDYGKTYFNVQLMGLPGNLNSFYYPPGCSLFFVLLYLTNPWKSPLVFRVEMLFFDFGISWMILKIAQIKILKINENMTLNALIFYSFSGIQVIIVLFFQKFDMCVIFLSLVGIYYTLQKKWLRSALFLVFCGFFKIYSFFWIAGIILFLIKTKAWKSFKSYTLSIILVGIIQVFFFFIIEGFMFFENLFQFGWHFTVWEEAYNLNWSYYLKYLNIPLLNFLPPALIIIVFLYYTLRRVEEIDLKFFINVIILIFLFYPSINYHYMIWLIPLIGLNFPVEFQRKRMAIFWYDIIHVNLDLNLFLWLILFGFGDFIYVKTFTGPEMVVVLVARLIIIIPMLIGLFFYFDMKKTNAQFVPLLSNLKTE
jgi:hypothetical protein